MQSTDANLTCISCKSMGKMKQKMKVGATKIQSDGSDKNEITKRGYHKNIIIVLVNEMKIVSCFYENAL